MTDTALDIATAAIEKACPTEEFPDDGAAAVLDALREKYLLLSDDDYDRHMGDARADERARIRTDIDRAERVSPAGDGCWYVPVDAVFAALDSAPCPDCRDGDTDCSACGGSGCVRCDARHLPDGSDT